jgi:hypothetical protein
MFESKWKNPKPDVQRKVPKFGVQWKKEKHPFNLLLSFFTKKNSTFEKFSSDF